MSSDGSTLLFKRLPAHLRLASEEKIKLRAFALELTLRVAGGKPFSCLVTNDRELQTLNRTFLNHDYPTDVLSFPQPGSSEALGDLAISIERAAEQAKAFRHTVVDEMRILMLHGVLHLKGMDHERDRGEMARAERKLRDEFGLPNNLIGRVRK